MYALVFVGLNIRAWILSCASLRSPKPWCCRLLTGHPPKPEGRLRSLLWMWSGCNSDGCGGAEAGPGNVAVEVEIQPSP